MLKIRKLLPVALMALVLGVAVTLSVSPLVFAHEHDGADGSPSHDERVTVDERRDERKTEAKQRLDDRRLKICQNRERTIHNIMGRMSDRGSKRLDVFNKIFERTQVFYTTKGKTAANYDALVADANAKKAAAEVAVAKAKTTSVDFKCDGSDPKGMASAFQGNLKEQNEALKAYKTSIRNLIVAVKSAQPSTAGQR